MDFDGVDILGWTLYFDAFFLGNCSSDARCATALLSRGQKGQVRHHEDHQGLLLGCLAGQLRQPGCPHSVDFRMLWFFFLQWDDNAVISLSTSPIYACAWQCLFFAKQYASFSRQCIPFVSGSCSASKLRVIAGLLGISLQTTTADMLEVV